MPRMQGSAGTLVLSALALLHAASVARASEPAQTPPPASWWLETGPPFELAGREILRGELVGAGQDGTLFLATEAGLWHRDGSAGSTASEAWRRAGASPAFTAELVSSDPAAPQLVIAVANLLVPLLPQTAPFPLPVRTGFVERSFDRGRSFGPCLPQLVLPDQGQWSGENRAIAAVAHDPSDPGAVFLASGDGLFRAELDECEGVELLSPRALADLVALPGSGGVVLVAASRASFSGPPSELLRSTDGGASWEAALPGSSPDVARWALARTPGTSTVGWALGGIGDADQLALGDLELELWRSAKNGASWRRRSELPLRGVPLDLGVDAAGRLFAVVATVDEEARLLRSTDSGRTWSVVTPARSEPTARLVVHPFGIGWTTSARLNAAGGIATGDPSRIFSSGDGGASWQELDPPAAPEVARVAVTGAQLLTLQPGTFLSADAGETWSDVDLSLPVGLAASDLRAPLQRSEGSGALYTTTHHLDALVIASEDGGLGWVAASDGLPSAGSVALARSGSVRSDDVLVFVEPCPIFLCNDPNPSFATGSVLRSDDGGASWSLVSKPRFPIVTAIDALERDGVLAVATVGSAFAPGRLRQDHLMSSVDDGSTFSSITPPSLAGALLWVEILDLEGGVLTMLLGTQTGVYRTDDSGVTWQRAELHSAAYIAVPPAADPDDPDRLFLGTDRAGVFESFDAGRTWRSLPGLAGGLAVRDLAFDAATRTLWAGTDAGLFARMRPSGGACAASETAHCLAAGRFLVETRFRVGDAVEGSGRTVPITSDTGAFWFFDAENVELIVKVLEGCTTNGSWWVFATGLTDVEVELVVTDTATGGEWRTLSPARTPFAPVFDTAAFPCP